MHKLTIVCLVQFSIFLSVTVEGVSMTVNPSSMVIGSTNPANKLELRCASDGTDNSGIFSLVISRRRSFEIDFIGILTIDVFGVIKQDKIPSDILAKSPNVSGSLVGSPSTSGSLMLTMNAGDITCNDQAEFKCAMSYVTATDTESHTASASGNLAVITAPNDVRITDSLYEDRGMQLQLANDSRLNVGTRITYRCYANIGVDPNVLITWERTSLLGTSTVFAAYTPTVITDIVQDPVTNSSCSYTRTSTMYYNMTSLDDDGVTFRCKVRAYIGSQWYEPISVHRRTFANSHLGSTRSPATKYSSLVSTTATSSGVNIDGQEVSQVSISEVMAITLGVLFGASIVLIVILSICLHRYRKLAVELKSRAQSRPQVYYGLKETVESSAPYAVLNKEPPDNHQQSDYLNAYDRLNRTVGHSEPYDMLERDNADQRVPEENKPYINMEHNVL